LHQYARQTGQSAEEALIQLLPKYSEEIERETSAALHNEMTQIELGEISLDNAITIQNCAIKSNQTPNQFIHRLQGI